MWRSILRFYISYEIETKHLFENHIYFQQCVGVNVISMGNLEEKFRKAFYEFVIVFLFNVYLLNMY